MIKFNRGDKWRGLPAFECKYREKNGLPSPLLATAESAACHVRDIGYKFSDMSVYEVGGRSPNEGYTGDLLVLDGFAIAFCPGARLGGGIEWLVSPNELLSHLANEDFV